MSDFVLYGAYGYTGRLITAMAADYGLRPLLSGRNADKLAALAAEFGLDHQACALDDRAELEALLRPYPLVLHAAGPFARTAAPMHAACLATQTHYLDITGEIPAFARAAKLHATAQTAGVMLLPGVGFDVVPTDCLAAHLKEALPDADHLTLAFAWRGGILSHGTAKTMVEGLGYPGAIRENGKIKPVPAAYDVREFPFTEERSMKAVTIPWGDVFTAYFTTGIPNIRTYFATPSDQIRLMKWSNYVGPLLRLRGVKNFLQNRIDDWPAGPDDDQRAQAEAFIYGEVSNAAGERRAARLRTPEGYTITAQAALVITQRVLDGAAEPGFRTPAGLLGADFILEFDGVRREAVR